MIKMLDAKGRCCGRKPIYYRGGSRSSPPVLPRLVCVRCDREYYADGYLNGYLRANWAWDCNGNKTLPSVTRSGWW